MGFDNATAQARMLHRSIAYDGRFNSLTITEQWLYMRMLPFVDDEGKKYDKAFRLVNDKPMAKLDKTKEVEIFKEVEEKEVNDLLTEKEYLVECDFLYEELKNSGKCLKFGFTNGNGFKTYYAYVYIDKLYNMLFMKLGRGLKSEIIQNIKEVMKNQQKAKDIQLKVSGVDKAKIEDLIKI